MSVRRIALLTGAVALGVALLTGAACAGGEDGDGAAVEAAARAAVEAYNSGDLEAFLAVVSDDFPANVFGAFGVTSKQDLLDEGFEVGEPPFENVEISNVVVSGGTASIDVDHDEGRARIFETATFVRQGDAWLLDDTVARRVDTPGGAAEADLGLVEFAFNLTRLSFPAGDVAFQVSNDGEQPHEMGIARLPEGLSLEEALEAEDLEEVGGEEIAFFFPIDSGAEATWLVRDLEPGRYGYACFVPDSDDPEGTPHAFKGMVGEFTVE